MKDGIEERLDEYAELLLEKITILSAYQRRNPFSMKTMEDILNETEERDDAYSDPMAPTKDNNVGIKQSLSRLIETHHRLSMDKCYVPIDHTFEFRMRRDLRTIELIHLNYDAAHEESVHSDANVHP